MYASQATVCPTGLETSILKHLVLGGGTGHTALPLPPSTAPKPGQKAQSHYLGPLRSKQSQASRGRRPEFKEQTSSEFAPAPTTALGLAT